MAITRKRHTLNVALRTRNVVSLCAGCGGLELGIGLALRLLGERARGICYVEREAAAAASLVASMEAGWLHPAPVWSDLLTFDARQWRGVVHILASGDPCQDNSVAGKRAGADGQRFLAPEVIRVADECGADLIFRENVPGNADGQLEAIVPPLERLGYSVAAGIFSSAETGNTMRRERLFIMAKRANLGHERHGHAGGWRPRPADDDCQLARATLQRCGKTRADHGRGHSGQPSARLARPSKFLPPAVIPGPTDSRWLYVLDRWPELQPALSKEEAESHLRRGIDAVADRVERLRATGNGVDPVVAAYAYLSLGALLAGHQPAGLTAVNN